MRCLLMDHVNEAGWADLPPAEQAHWLGAYRGPAPFDGTLLNTDLDQYIDPA